MRRLLSIVLCLTICLSMFSGITRAEDTDEMIGDGSAEHPYEICTAEHLEQFRDKVNAGEVTACAKLMNHIVFNEGVIFGMDEETFDPLVNGVAVTEETFVQEWKPISVPDSGDFSMKNGWYVGIFDGQGYTISGLYCNYQQSVMIVGMSAAGLFSALGKGGVIKNVGIVNSYFRGDGAAPIVVGCQGTVTGCYSDAFVVGLPQTAVEEGKGANAYAGGITAITIRADAEISRCFYVGTLEGFSYTKEDNTVVKQYGGIAGTNGYGVMLAGTEKFYDNYFIDSVEVEQPVGCNNASAEAFSSGEVAYLLNHGESVTDDSMLFNQSLNSDSESLYPSFGQGDGQEGNEVFQITGCDGLTYYSNQDIDQSEHDFDANGVCQNICGKTAQMLYTVSGGVTEFVLDAAEAIEAVKGKTARVTLYSNVALNSPWVITGGDIMLDLNGFEISCAGSDGMVLQVNGSNALLTVWDDSENGTGSVKSTYTGTECNSGAITVTAGEAAVESGKVIGTGGYALAVTGGNVVITGGSFESSGREHSVKLTEGDVISGGTFKGLDCDVALKDIFDTDKNYEAVDASGTVLDASQSSFSQTLTVQRARKTDSGDGNGGSGNGGTGGSGNGGTGGSGNEGTDGSGGNSGTEERPDYSQSWPDAPEMDGNGAPMVYVPYFTDVDYDTDKEELYLILDVNPLLGISRAELMESMVLPEWKGYEIICDIPEYDEGKDKICTSDRLEISIRKGNKIVQRRTFVIVILGDTNCDGMAMANDAALMVKLASGSGTEAEEVRFAGDMNRDGKVMANDAQALIYKYFNYYSDYETPLNYGAGG